MSDHTIELDDLNGQVTLTEAGEEATWPEPSIELTVKWHPAEPDVGIFSSQPEITKIQYCLDGEWFTDEKAFVSALYDLVGEWMEETHDELAGMIANRIENAEADLEEGE